MSVKETNNISLSTSNYFVQSKENLNTMSPISMRMMDPLKIFSSLPSFNSRLSLNNNVYNSNDPQHGRVDSGAENGDNEKNVLSLPFFQSMSSSTPSAMPGTSPSKITSNKAEMNQGFQVGSGDEEKSLQNNQTKGDDDFCNLCQKHFCNKYYLRKHKQDVHGIQSEPFSIARRRESSSNYNNNNNNNSFNPSSLAGSLTKCSSTPKMTTGDEQNDGSCEIGEPDALSLFKQSPLSMIPNIAKIFAHYNAKNPQVKLGPDSLSNISEILQTKFSLNNNNSNSTSNETDEHSNNESPSDLPVNKSSRPSGTNMDSFKSSMAAAKLADRVTCELCKKELCNKYFLRTHKFKVHGISQNDTSNNSLGRNGTDLNHSQREDINETSSSSPTIPTKQTDQPIPMALGDSAKMDEDFTPDTTTGKTIDHETADKKIPINPAQEFLKSFMEGNEKKFNGITSKTICPLCGVNVGIKFLLPGHLCQVHSLSITDPMFILCTLKANLSGQDDEPQQQQQQEKLPDMTQAKETLVNNKGFGSNLSDSPENQSENTFSTASLMLSQNWPQGFNLNLFNNNAASSSNNVNNSSSSNNVNTTSPQLAVSQQQSLLNSKSPNQMRVLCDICNKWICNKYFLRTHKANKHGIYDGMMKPSKKKLLKCDTGLLSGDQMAQASLHNLLGPLMQANGPFDFSNSNLESLVQQNLLNEVLLNNGQSQSSKKPSSVSEEQNQASCDGETRFNFDPAKISQFIKNNQMNNFKIDNVHIPLNLSLKELLPLRKNGKSFKNSLDFQRKLQVHSNTTIKIKPLHHTVKSFAQQRASYLVQRSCFLLRRSNIRQITNNLCMTRQRRKRTKETRERNSLNQCEVRGETKTFQIPCIMCPNSTETYNLSTLIEHFQSIHSKPSGTDLPLDSIQGILPNLITAMGKQRPENLISSTSSSSSSSGLEFDSSLPQSIQNIGQSLFNPFLLKLNPSLSNVNDDPKLDSS